jgi:hypothetical protein
MSEIPRPRSESLQSDIDGFVLESAWVAEGIASAIEEETMDLDTYKGRVDLVLRNPGVLYDRELTLPSELGGPLNEDQLARVTDLNDKAKAVLIREGITPDENDTNHLLTLPTVMSRRVSPLASQYIPEIIREGNALVAEVVSTGKVNPNLTRYFSSNITAISSSIARTE